MLYTYRLSSSIGLTNETSGQSCKQLFDQLADCPKSLRNGLYWVRGMQVGTKREIPILIVAS